MVSPIPKPLAVGMDRTHKQAFPEKDRAGERGVAVRE